MFVLQVQKRSITQRVRRVHRQRVEAWKEAGALGKKPKLYETVENIVLQGLEHNENPLHASEAAH